ncbi:4-hydroxy-2-oxovalerate aldolase [Saccharibacter sp. 17.LH.SD]|nr:4-hydroxy-2-oxovalerate aldolase [Saccharibacter sp. 17.LH.SD]
MMAAAGYDYVILDMEHTLQTETDIARAIELCHHAGIEPWVRVPDADVKRIGRLLDHGADAIVLPQCRNLSSVRRALAATHFPPHGTRGITGGRVTRFGALPLNDYVERVNQRPFLIVMIETQDAYNLLPDIVDLPGIAAILEGAVDLALDLGLGPDPFHPKTVRMIQKMADMCDAARVPFIANPRDQAQRHYWAERNHPFLLAGEDRGLLVRALKTHRSSLTQEASSTSL